jgi:signal transduction histidine kinase
MIKKLVQNLTIFNRLNSKIVTYFLAFAFLPLLVFSIFGYYLNKDLITKINLSHLRSLNTTTAREIKLYLQSKNRIIIESLKDFKSLKKTVPLQYYLNNQEELSSDFIKLKVISSKFDYTIPGSGVQNADDVSSPTILFTVGDIRVEASISHEEIGELIGSNVKEIQNIVYFLNSKKKLTKEALKFIDNDEFLLLTTSISKMGSQVEEHFLEEEEYLSSFTFQSDQNIVIVTRVDAQTFYSELNSFRNKILIANIGFAIILVMLAIIFSRHITTPIHRLIEASQTMGRGNLDKKIVIETNDEIQILANEFELMRERLQESYQHMEEKIEKRTFELQEAQAQVSHQEKMASLGMMAAGIAHEIGNPLTSISSMAQVIKRKNENHNISEYVTNILKNIDRISRIVRELVDFSRPSSYEEAPSDLNEIIKSAVGIIKYDRRSKYLTYSLNLDPELPKTVLVSDHLLQVFLNILINSVDASEGSGDEISVKSFIRNENIHIEFSDKGIGIPEQMQKKIFEPFFTTKEVGKGTGLGLTVSYGFIKKLKGEIKVKSEEGKGSIFSVIIPVRTYIEE